MRLALASVARWYYGAGMNPDALRQMIDERAARRDKLRSQIEALELEIRVLQEAAARVTGATVPAVERRTRRSVGAEVRDRALKREWASALQFIGRSGTATLDDIMSWSAAEGAGIKRNTLRSQLSIYTERGWVERVADGVYSLTPEGAAKCDFEHVARNDEADLGSSQAGPSSEGDNLFRDPAGTA